MLNWGLDFADDTDSNASNIGSSVDDEDGGDSNEDDGDEDDDEEDEDDEERRTRFGSMASPSMGTSMGASPPMGLSYWGRAKAGLDSFALPVGVAHQQVRPLFCRHVNVVHCSLCPNAIRALYCP